MANAGETVLITGAVGWLGLRLVETVVRGFPAHETLRLMPPVRHVRAMVLPGQNVECLAKITPAVEIVSGDIRNPVDCARFCAGARGAVLFHAAGVIHPRRIRDFYDVNVKGTKNLLSAAAQAGIRRAVVVSSNSPCGCNLHPGHIFDEHSPYNPYMHYGRSKMLMELCVKSFHGITELETVVVRAPWFYGINQPPRQTLFFAMIRDGKAPIVAGGGSLRSMSYIDNLCQGLLLAAFNPSAVGQVYWIADQRPYTMNEIVDTVEHLLESEFGYVCSHRRLRLPSITADMARGVDMLLQTVGLYNQKIHVLSEMNQSIACSIARAQRELNYMPTVELEEGMRRSLQWCADNGVRF